MSELKAYSGHEIREDIDYNTRGIDPEDKEWRNYGKKLCDTLYYRKSEADKVIAGLKADYKEACERLQTANLIKDEQLAATRHNKHKRCLAMASKCRLRARWFGDNAFYKKEQRALQWHKRWLELAEKFKPNSTLQQKD